MGAACCAAENDGSVAPLAEVMKDLPAPSPTGDTYERFECSLPFNRITIANFERCVNDARLDKPAAEGGEIEKEDFVTFESLRKSLTTNAWKDLTVGDSPLHKLLSSKEFQVNGGAVEGRISVESLLVMGLLHCAGKPEEKAKTLYCVLQDGGFADHAQISASDKDLVPVFQKFCAFVTKEIFDLAANEGGIVCMYEKFEVDKMLKKDTVEELREEQWLDSIYGTQSRLDNDLWVAKVKKEAKWIFSAKEMRTRIFALAEV